MKKNFLKKILGLGAAVAMMACMVLPAAADPAENVKTATAMGKDYYMTLESAVGVSLIGNPQLFIKKYVHLDNDPTQVDTSKPINGVEFKYAKVGDLYQLTLDDGKTVMAYGVTDAFAEAASLKDSADYKKTDNGITTYFFKDGSDITTAMAGTTAATFENFLTIDDGSGGKQDNTANGVKSNTTGTNGIIEAGLNVTNEYGLYLVVEYDVTGAKVNDNPISITKTQAPFVVALPTYDGQYWDETVEANVKNSTGTADVEKKIVVGTDETLTSGTEMVADTDITSIGDTVHFRLKGDIIDIPEGGKSIVSFKLTDQISKGLTPILDGETVKIDEVRIVGDNTNTNPITTLETDEYEVSALNSITSRDAFNGGQEFTISVIGEGLNKLTTVAKKTGVAEKAIYFYYSAEVNENAVIGPNADDVAANSGNPNQVMLKYKVDGNSEMQTRWDKVTEFTFGIDVTKTLEGDTSGTNMSQVKFKVYSGSSDNKTYYKFEVVTGSEGVYTKPVAVSNGDTPTELIPATSGKLQIKGLEEGTYYLEEVATAAGYNLLKEPVEFKIKADTGNNAFVVDADQTSVNNQYLGTITNDGNSKNGYAEATVINTKGFTLPSTGGAGIWMFVIGGVLVIGAGCAYFMMTKRRKEGR